ncbi:hypothetical protein HSX11_02765 [Oxalobacteraceae bacterium]|nr:hypothetical protein [Oxalobacteraceae bacterium]
MSLISYADNFEDVLLWRALGHLSGGCYLDIGVTDPEHGSATRQLYQQGWRGVSLVPAPAALRQLRIARPAGVHLAGLAGAGPGLQAVYECAGGGTVRISVDEACARQWRADGHEVLRHEATLHTLDQLCAEHVDGPLHLLVLNAGGAEQAALAGLDLARWRPWVIVLRQPPGVPVPALAAAGYRLAHTDGLNQYHVAPEHAGLLAALALPPHPADAFVLREFHPYSHSPAPLYARLAEAEQALAQAAAHAQAQQAEADAAAAAIAAAVQRADGHALELQAREQRIATLDHELAQAGARAHSAESAVLDLQLRLRHSHDTLHATVSSLSWRLTRPLRLANLLLHRAANLARRVLRRIRRDSAGAVRGLLRRSLRFVTSRPALSYFVRRNLARLPFMVPLMRSVKYRIESAKAASAVAPPASHLDQLSSSTRQVLDDLQRLRAPHS